MKNPLENLWTAIALLFAAFAVISHWAIQWDFLFLPLEGDESYYASTEVLRSFWNWPSYSFGHPPLWHYINALAYSVFGVSSVVARSVGLLFSTSLLVGLFAWGWYRGQLLLATLLMIVVAGYAYILKFGSFNHPVAATAFFGTLAMIFANEKKWLWFCLFVTLALNIRESALVYLLGSLFLVNEKKELKYFVPPTLIFLFFYAWYYISEDKLLLNNQVQILLSTGHSPFIVTFNNLKAQLLLLLSQYHWGFAAIFLSVLSLFLFRRQSPFTRMALAFVFVIVAHTLFFGFYVDSSPRNTFLAATALVALTLHWAQVSTVTTPWKNVLWICCGILLLTEQFHHTVTPSYKLIELQEEAQLHKELVATLKTLGLPNKDITIVATNPYHTYLDDLLLGYTDVAFEVHWHGGAPGYSQLPKFQVGIVHIPLEQWPEQEIMAAAKKHQFRLYREITGHFQSIQIWVDPIIFPHNTF